MIVQCIGGPHPFHCNIPSNKQSHGHRGKMAAIENFIAKMIYGSIKAVAVQTIKGIIAWFFSCLRNNRLSIVNKGVHAKNDECTVTAGIIPHIFSFHRDGMPSRACLCIQYMIKRIVVIASSYSVFN